jgi:hypothetical protein
MEEEKVKEVLMGYEPITLKEMDNVKLMDRTDTKFVFPARELPGILKAVQSYYRSLEVSGTRVSKYETLYYDTHDLRLYQRHHSGKLNRYKVRSRRYVESDLHFFEVKFKNNKGRTIKDRIKTRHIESDLGERSVQLLQEKTNIEPSSLKATIWINYSRITLVNKHSAERLTIDIGLNFRVNDRTADLGNIVIAEVKQDKASSSSPIINVMRERRIKPGSISKYCFGIITMFDQVRKNNFKEKVRGIKKIAYAA